MLCYTSRNASMISKITCWVGIMLALFGSVLKKQSEVYFIAILQGVCIKGATVIALISMLGLMVGGWT